MRAIRWVVVVLVVAHGLVHLLGAVEGLGWADLEQGREPIGAAAGIGWLAATIVVVVAGLALAVRARGWWMLVLAGAVVSQAMVLTSWGDAKAGTAANVVMLAAAAYGYAAARGTSATERHPNVAAA